MPFIRMCIFIKLKGYNMFAAKIIQIKMWKLATHPIPFQNVKLTVGR